LRPSVSELRYYNVSHVSRTVQSSDSVLGVSGPSYVCCTSWTLMCTRFLQDHSRHTPHSSHSSTHREKLSASRFIHCLYSPIPSPFSIARHVYLRSARPSILIPLPLSPLALSRLPHPRTPSILPLPVEIRKPSPRTSRYPPNDPVHWPRPRNATTRTPVLRHNQCPP
jgi:hypothetical protein